MNGNSKPLRWDAPTPIGLWGMEIGAQWTEEDARAKLLSDLGEVDECFIHITSADHSRRGLRYMYVSQRETDGADLKS